jgi:hypothetical protein
MDSEHPLHCAINSQKGNRLKRGKSWMGQAEEAIRLVCPPEEIALGEDWLIMPQYFCTTFSVIIMLGRSCRSENPVEAKVQALIFENSSDKDNHIH